jgi:hypothetical protein
MIASITANTKSASKRKAINPPNMTLLIAISIYHRTSTKTSDFASQICRNIRGIGHEGDWET